MKNNNRGSVFTEYIVVLLVCALGVYFSLVGGNDDPSDTSDVKPLVDAVHDRQQSFVDAILKP